MRQVHNPVERAYRTLVFSRGKAPWLLIADDIQKDKQERLYEWLMQTGFDTELLSLSSNDIILCDASVSRDVHGRPKPKAGDRLLLVRVLGMNDPADSGLYQSRPSFRLEAYERKDTLLPKVTNGALSGDRSFGMDKRLVIASRSVAPDFRILLYPHRSGEPLPETVWSDPGRILRITTPHETRRLSFRTENGLSGITFV